jgi:hypothetical protein
LKSRRNFGAALKIQHHAAGVAVARDGARSPESGKLSTLGEIGQESKRMLLLKKSSQS